MAGRLFVSAMRDTSGAVDYVTITDDPDSIPAEVRHADLYAIDDAPALGADMLRMLATVFVAAGVDLEINGADLYAAFGGNRRAMEEARAQFAR